MNILVLCTGNSARSILLESIFNTCGEGRIMAWSAGSRPTGAVHPQSLKLLAQRGHNTANAKSKSWKLFAEPGAPVMDVVITVCGSAAGEVCPIWPGVPLRAHWGVEDPAAADPTRLDAAFADAYDILKRRAERLFDQKFEEMNPDQIQSALDEIGASH